MIVVPALVPDALLALLAALVRVCFAVVAVGKGGTEIDAVDVGFPRREDVAVCLLAALLAGAALALPFGAVVVACEVGGGGISTDGTGTFSVFIGETGRASRLRIGDSGAGRIGECGSVRELCDLGERT